MICNVYEYFEKKSRKHKGSVYPKFGKKTADATGYCKRTVERVLGEKRNVDSKAFTSPAKRYKKSRIQIVIDDYDCDAIRRSVHDVYANKYREVAYFEREGTFCRWTYNFMEVA